MNPIDRLKQESDNAPVGYHESKLSFKENYELSSNKREFLISVAKDIGRPHYPSLHLTIEKNPKVIQIDRILYDGDLQDRLAKHKEEKDKMSVMTGHICYNNLHQFKNGGGNVSIGLVLDSPIDKADQNGFKVLENNPLGESNQVAFRALKSISVYEKYVFGEVKGDNMLGVYGDIYYMIPELRQVKTFTIIYVVNDKTIREVTLHDFEKYGNILTKLNLKVE